MGVEQVTHTHTHTHTHTPMVITLSSKKNNVEVLGPQTQGSWEWPNGQGLGSICAVFACTHEPRDALWSRLNIAEPSNNNHTKCQRDQRQTNSGQANNVHITGPDSLGTPQKLPLFANDHARLSQFRRLKFQQHCPLSTINPSVLPAALPVNVRVNFLDTRKPDHTMPEL